MAVKTYLQSALSQVQAALTDMESQMQGMQQTADARKRQLLNEISNMERERTTENAAIAREQDTAQRTVIDQRVNALNRQMDDHRAEISRIETDLAHAQQRKDELHRNLYNAMNELTRLMSLPDIG